MAVRSARTPSWGSHAYGAGCPINDLLCIVKVASGRIRKRTVPYVRTYWRTMSWIALLGITQCQKKLSIVDEGISWKGSTTLFHIKIDTRARAAHTMIQKAIVRVITPLIRARCTTRTSHSHVEVPRSIHDDGQIRDPRPSIHADSGSTSVLHCTQHPPESRYPRQSESFSSNGR